MTRPEAIPVMTDVYLYWPEDDLRNRDSVMGSWADAGLPASKQVDRS